MRRPLVVRVYKNAKAGGGVQTRLLELLPRLAEHLDVRLLCYRNRGQRAGELEAAGVPVDVVPLGSKWAPWNMGRYVRYFRRHGPALVHTHEYTANTLGIYAARRAGVAVRVRHLHTLVPWGWGGPLATAVRVAQDRFLARRADLTLAVSGAVRDLYLARTGLPADSCRVLYNGVDLAPFRDARRAGAALRAELGIDPGSPVAGIVGRLAKGKGHADFLEAGARLAARIPALVLLVVGEGALRPALEERAAAPDLAGRVRFTGYRADVAACLGALDVFAFPSRPEVGGRIQDGFGSAVVEAQAAGVPVVAYRLPATAETLADGVSGAVVASGDVTALAERMAHYLEHPETARAAGEAGRRFAERFSLDHCVEETLNLYDSLLRRAGAPCL